MTPSFCSLAISVFKVRPLTELLRMVSGHLAELPSLELVSPALSAPVSIDRVPINLDSTSNAMEEKLNASEGTGAKNFLVLNSREVNFPVVSFKAFNGSLDKGSILLCNFKEGHPRHGGHCGPISVQARLDKYQEGFGERQQGVSEATHQ